MRMDAATSLRQAQEVIRTIVASHFDRPSLVARIACEVGAEIIEGIIPPGYDLNTVELARRYDTSRTPVREALLLLEAEGLVDIEPRRRPRAHAHSIEEVREIYRTRSVLFELMAAELAQRATAEDIAHLEEIVARMATAEAADDAVAFTWLSVEFHEADTRLAGNRTAKRIHDSLLLRTIPLRRLSLSLPDRMKRSLDNHIQLVKSYESHDAALAAALLRANHSGALQAIEAHHARTGALLLPPPGNAR